MLLRADVHSCMHEWVYICMCVRQYYKSVFYASEGGCIFVCTDDFVFTYVSVCMREKEDNKSVFYVSGGGHIYLYA